MKIGIIGIGKMGTAIALRLSQSQHELILFDINSSVSTELGVRLGASIAQSIQELASMAEIIWIMVPNGKPIEQTTQVLGVCASAKNIIIDAGNSYFKDSIRRADEFKSKNVALLDCGTSGGIYGVDNGFSFTIGGDSAAFDRAEPIFKILSREHGYMHTGPSGSGHYVKMVHNGIEYGLMQAYAEGIHVLHDGYFKNLDLSAITCTWAHGAVINSFILKMLNSVLMHHTNLENIEGFIGQTGTGKWTVEEAIAHNISVPVIEMALNQRFESERNSDNYANKLIALMRNKLGGHQVVTKDQREKTCKSVRGHTHK